MGPYDYAEAEQRLDIIFYTSAAAEGISRTQRIEGGSPHADEVAEYQIGLWATAYTFKPGHKIRVDVAFAAFPHWDRNLNVCEEPFGMSKKAKKAKQAILHDASHPSRIILPVYSAE